MKIIKFEEWQARKQEIDDYVSAWRIANPKSSMSDRQIATIFWKLYVDGTDVVKDLVPYRFEQWIDHGPYPC